MILTRTYFLVLLTFFCLLSCKKSKNQDSTVEIEKNIPTTHASGFKILEYPDFKIMTVSEPWPESEKSFTYLLLKKGKKAPDTIQADAIVTIPVQSIVVTSTTHIPSLEMLGVENTLSGFPNLDYISSKKTRKRINKGKVKELGQNESINTETTINLNPDVVVSFGVEGQNKSLSSIERAGIPVLYNGDWVEKKPLGKTEWIKFFAALYDKNDKADSIFKSIENNYQQAKKLASTASTQPEVLSGAMFKDVWYLPKGESWASQILEDANAKYVYANTSGTGSLAYSIEQVLDDAQQAEYWISPNAFTSYEELAQNNDAYVEFKAFKEKNIFGFGSLKGETGGLIYYELAPNRPDWVLQDLVYILHPELKPNTYTPHFFSQLD